MNINSLTFWRASLMFWLAALVYVVAMQIMRHPYPHPIPIFIIPAAMVLLSAFRLRGQTRNRNRP